MQLLLFVIVFVGCLKTPGEHQNTNSFDHQKETSTQINNPYPDTQDSFAKFDHDSSAGKKVSVTSRTPEDEAHRTPPKQDALALPENDEGFNPIDDVHTEDISQDQAILHDSTRPALRSEEEGSDQDDVVIPGDTSHESNKVYSKSGKKNAVLVPDHSLWNNLLNKHVNATGKVNYSGFKTDATSLDKYLQILRENPIQDDWSRKEKIAYLINVYNAFTVKLIADNYPLKSIMDLHGGKPWDVKWIKLGDETYSLNQIENEILRPQFKESRIHFAVNCAAISCPPLLNQAWTADNLDKLFDQQAEKFINNPAFNKISTNHIQVSKIFEWYAGDFGDLIDYLNQYSSTKIKKGAKISFLEYNWDLNE